MTTATDLHYLPLHELASRIEAKEVGPVEVAEAILERIERLNPKLNAYITVMSEQALSDARAAQDEIAGGTYRGPLHGVPVAVKDLCSTKGAPTTGGSTFLAEKMPDEDATVVRKLRDAGAVVVGKTHLHEFAFGATGVNPHYGPARNPWDTDRITGGSSSGSGAGVAAGLCFAALGSDTGGSIRIPAALCGIAGIKATFGRTSLHGLMPLAWTLDHVGPMARTTRDCALVLEAIAGHDANDPVSADVPVERWSAQLDDGVRGLRIGVPVDFAFDRTDADVAKPVREAIDFLRSLGAEVKELRMPQLKEYWGLTSIVLISEAAAYHKESLKQRPQDYGADIRARVVDMKATDYVLAARQRDELRRTVDETLMSGIDLLATPATISAAVTIDSVEQEDPTLGLTQLTAPFDLTGQPSMSVPCGFSDDGMPVGLMLTGRLFDEATVLRAAHAYETATDFASARPPVDEA